MPSSTAQSASSATARTAASERRYGGLSAQERSQQRHDKLLQAAIQVFGTLGLRKTTMRDICNEARIAERYFAEHFSCATQAYEAAYRQISEQAAAATGAAVSASALNTRDMARAGLLAFLRFIKDDPRRAQIMLVDGTSYWRYSSSSTNPELNRQALMMKRFGELLYPNLPDNLALDIVGAALIGASLRACVIWVQSGFNHPVEVVVDNLMFMWDGLDNWLKSQSRRQSPPVAAA
jgi:AcrR family transcriptional regulator